MSNERTIINCAFVTIGVSTARDFLPSEKGGTGLGFVPPHVLGGMATFTMLLLADGFVPELAKAFSVLIATIMFLYSGADILQATFGKVL